MTRLLTALVAVPLLLALILWAPSWAFTLVASCVAFLAYFELSGLARKQGHSVLGVGYVATPMLVASFHLEPHASFLLSVEGAALFAMLAIGVASVSLRTPGRESWSAVSASAFSVFYVGVLLGSLVGVRGLPPDVSGRSWTIFLLAVVMLGDGGAYYTGRAIGRRPLAPTLSPKKTVEGLVGGIAVSVLAALGTNATLLPEIPMWHAAALGLGIAVLAAIGDLFESLLKRSAGVKDTSGLIPGHGGFLDRLDSILFAAPLVYSYRLLVTA
jgi:phosphatidate cytidylyltransferase